MVRFLGCVFGYIIVAGLIGRALIASGPRWALYPFMGAFILGWLFVIGFAINESTSLRKGVAQGVEFIKDWTSAMMWIVLAAAVLILLSYLG